MVRTLKATALVLAAMAAASAADAQTSRRIKDLRDQQFRDSAAATEQRNQQARSTADSQQEVLAYKVRKAKRMELKQKCQLAGLSNC